MYRAAAKARTCAAGRVCVLVVVATREPSARAASALPLDAAAAAAAEAFAPARSSGAAGQKVYVVVVVEVVVTTPSSPPVASCVIVSTVYLIVSEARRIHTKFYLKEADIISFSELREVRARSRFRSARRCVRARTLSRASARPRDRRSTRTWASGRRAAAKQARSPNQSIRRARAGVPA